jgi:hypothetical protein
MSIKNALGQARLVTIGVLAAVGWMLLTGLRVFESIDFWGLADAGVVGDAIGPTAVGGVLGLVILTVTVLLAAQLLGELGETDPAPEPWPPE